jgi:hypothetical protein
MQLTMGIIKIEVSVPEAVQALEEFRKNRIQALDAISGEIRTAVASAFNTFLNTEMSLFLGRPDQSDNKRNGYQEREYALKGVGCLRIRMPVDRRRKFESAVVPHREQIDPRLKEEMAILHLAGLSTRTMAMVSKRVPRGGSQHRYRLSEPGNHRGAGSGLPHPTIGEKILGSLHRRHELPDPAPWNDRQRALVGRSGH